MASGNYNFGLIALVDDVNNAAAARIDQYNLAGFPTCFFDGGDEVYVGGSSNQSNYTNKMNICGARNVIPMNVEVATRHIPPYDFSVIVRVGNGVPANNPPVDPAAPTGPSVGAPGEDLTFEASTTDNDGAEELWYQFDFGDGREVSEWLGPYSSGAVCQVVHAYVTNGTYNVTVTVKDAFDVLTAPSAAHVVSMGCCQVPGDVDASSSVDVSDLTFLVDYLFAGGAVPSCLDQANIDGLGDVNVADLTYLVDYLFASGPAPAPCA